MTEPVLDEFVPAEAGQASYDRAVFFLGDGEQCAYDVDGNRGGNGGRIHTRDAENRLARMVRLERS